MVLREFDVLLCTAMSKRATDQEVRQAFRRFADALVKTVYAFLREVVTLTPNPNPNPNPNHTAMARVVRLRTLDFESLETSPPPSATSPSLNIRSPTLS